LFYKEAICNKCNKEGHLAKVCRSTSSHGNQIFKQFKDKQMDRTQWVDKSPTPEEELPLTHLDLLHPNVQATVSTNQAQQKKNHDVHTKQRVLLSIGTPIIAKNFISSTKWLPGVVIACVAPLTYLVQLQLRWKIWRRHIDHIVSKDDEVQEIPTRPGQRNCDQHGED